jgi:hypothetical protein
MSSIEDEARKTGPKATSASMQSLNSVRTVIAKREVKDAGPLDFHLVH